MLMGFSRSVLRVRPQGRLCTNGCPMMAMTLYIDCFWNLVAVHLSCGLMAYDPWEALWSTESPSHAWALLINPRPGSTSRTLHERLSRWGVPMASLVTAWRLAWIPSA